MLAGLVAAVLAWDAVRRLSPEDVRQRITEAVKSESGLDLVAARVTIQISYHVVIDFHAARLLDGKQQVARFARITLICGYRTLLFHRGLPFLSVIMEQPELVLPLHSVTPGPLPVMDAGTVADLRRILVRLSNITRQVAMFLVREETPSSLPAIGKAFGGRDHTTALHSIEKIANELKEDERLRYEVQAIREKLYVQ